MSFRVRLIVLPLIVFLLFGGCTRKSSEGRKIKLSELRTESTKERDEQEVTILKFEPEKQRSIAVLYFENKTGDLKLDWLRKGLAEMLITDLSQSRYLDVLSLERLYDIFKSLNKQAGQSMDIELADAVAKEAHVQAVLTGNFVKEGDSLKIIVQLREAGTGKLLKEEQVTGPGLERIFTMVDDLTRKIKDGLRVTLKGTEEIDRRLADLTTTSLEAYQHFTQGMDYNDQFFYTEAIEQFKKALELEPNNKAYVNNYLKFKRNYERAISNSRK
ncbi:MAG: hypothetical protein ONB05_07020 [candidate division KSB1 bacterium]|nr:hypothetical protein [candidate division KSB1 bacterium]